MKSRGAILDPDLYNRLPQKALQPTIPIRPSGPG
jgi:hypothetical protein